MMCEDGKGKCQMKQIERFGIIRNTGIPEAERTAEMICAYLADRDRTCVVSTTGAELPDGTECALVLGGDGTLLRAAKVVIDRQIPLLGINLGTLGYLAEIERDGLTEALDRLIGGRYSIESRMMLEGTVYQRGRAIFHDVALNDVYMKGLRPLRSYRFLNYVNGAYLNRLTADGIILSTPTGSTGYALSVGGPILSPEGEMIMMTPIAAHSLVTGRSIVLPATDRIRVEIGEGRTGVVPGAARVLFDGAHEMRLNTGDAVEVRRADRCTRIIRVNNISFLEVLRKKMAES